MIAFHIYALLDLPLILIFIRQLLISKSARKLIVVAIVGYTLFSFVHMAVVGIANYNSIQIAVDTIIILVFSLYFFFEIFQYEQIDDLSSYAPFWIVSVFMLYYGGTFFLNLIFGEVVNGNITKDIDLLNLILLILTNIVLTLCLWMGRTPRTSN